MGVMVKSEGEHEADIDQNQDIASPSLMKDLRASTKILTAPPNGTFFGLSKEGLEAIAFPARTLPALPGFVIAESVDLFAGVVQC